MAPHAAVGVEYEPSSPVAEVRAEGERSGATKDAIGNENFVLSLFFSQCFVRPSNLLTSLFLSFLSLSSFSLSLSKKKKIHFHALSLYVSQFDVIKLAAKLTCLEESNYELQVRPFSQRQFSI